MTLHVCARSLLRLLLAAILLRLPTPAIALSVSVAPASPTLTERLERLAAEFDRNRIDLQVPGAVLAIVRGEDVSVARGFGDADIEKKMGGRMIFQVERVEVGVELAPDTFTLQPSIGAGRGR